MEEISGGVNAPEGFYSAGVHCGLRKNADKRDLALIYSDVLCNASAVFTTNQVKGEPLKVTREHIKDGLAQAIIVNSANANACTGEDGIRKAEKMTEMTAERLKLKSQNVLVASTGVIGVPLDIKAIESGMDSLTKSINRDNFEDACEAIMTTDTVKKIAAVSFKIDDADVKIGAMAKGSGMIHPNMATMLGFITTDLNITTELLHDALKKCVSKTFNRISVDGDTSTNDMVIILANGKAGNKKITGKDKNYEKFYDALKFVCTKLAKMIAKDGEGATKLIECKVMNAPNESDAEILAKSVIKSNLVKAACFGSDANWGRVLCALGYSKAHIDQNKIDVAFESSKGIVEVFKQGVPLAFDEKKAKKILDESEIKIDVNLNSGDCTVSAWGCDLTYNYVKINGEYRT